MASSLKPTSCARARAKLLQQDPHGMQASMSSAAANKRRTHTQINATSLQETPRSRVQYSMSSYIGQIPRSVGAAAFPKLQRPLRRRVHYSPSSESVASVKAPVYQPPVVKLRSDFVVEKEAPCKRSLRLKEKATKILPRYWALLGEEEEEALNRKKSQPAPSRVIVTETATTKAAPKRSKTPKSLHVDGTEYRRAYGGFMNNAEVDEGKQSDAAADADTATSGQHTVRFGRREKVSPEFVQQLQESRRQQALDLLSDHRRPRGATKGSLSVHPKYQLTPVTNSTLTQVPPMSAQLQEPEYGRTLNELADRQTFKLSHILPSERFQVEDELSVQALLLAKQKAEQVRVDKEMAEAKQRSHQMAKHLKMTGNENQTVKNSGPGQTQIMQRPVEQRLAELPRSELYYAVNNAKQQQAVIAATAAAIMETELVDEPKIRSKERSASVNAAPVAPPPISNSKSKATSSSIPTSAPAPELEQAPATSKQPQASSANQQKSPPPPPSADTSQENIYKQYLEHEMQRVVDVPQPPRLDDIHQEVSDNQSTKNYAQTWMDFPTLRPKQKNAIRTFKASPPPWIKRSKHERPETAKPFYEESSNFSVESAE